MTVLTGIDSSDVTAVTVTLVVSSPMTPAVCGSFYSFIFEPHVGCV